MNNLVNSPVHLIIGSEEKSIQLIEEQLQRHFCTQASNSPKNKTIECFCRICRQIKQRQHASLIWIDPEGNYTVKDTEVIFERTKFALDNNEHFFFLLCHESIHSILRQQTDF